MDVISISQLASTDTHNIYEARYQCSSEDEGQGILNAAITNGGFINPNNPDDPSDFITNAQLHMLIILGKVLILVVFGIPIP